MPSRRSQSIRRRRNWRIWQARWKQASIPDLWQRLKWALAVSVATALIVPLAAGKWTPMVSFGLLLAAWSLAAPEQSSADVLAWAGSACREVTMIAQQVHGAIGFALESDLHRAYRRAKTIQVWAEAARQEFAS